MTCLIHRNHAELRRLEEELQKRDTFTEPPDLRIVESPPPAPPEFKNEGWLWRVLGKARRAF